MNVLGIKWVCCREILSIASCCGVIVGTHGNGVEFGNLATLVTGLELVNGKGEVCMYIPAHVDNCLAIINLSLAGVHQC